MTPPQIGTIYYLIPDIYNRKIVLKDLLIALKRGRPLAYLKAQRAILPRPVGGIKVIYQHCMLLKALGYQVYPLIMGDYIGNFFGFELEMKHVKDTGFRLESNDIVVGNEFLPYDALQFSNARKVLFLQNWINIGKKFKTLDNGKNYLQLGYDYVITCGAYCTERLYKEMAIPATTITNGIDLDTFTPAPERRVSGRVLAMSRKNAADLQQIRQILQARNIDFHIVDRLAQAELLEEYRQADIFLAMGYPEGFSLPPLEAMSCGCAVAGFTGGGADEFMIDQETALVAADGDCAAAARKLAELLDNPALKETIRAKGTAMAQTYTLANTQQKADAFYRSLT